MGKHRVLHNPVILALAKHHIYRIVQHHFRNPRGAVGHEHLRVRLPPCQDRQRADMVLVSVRYENGVDLSLRDGRKVRRGGKPLNFGMQPGVDDDALSSDAQPV